MTTESQRVRLQRLIALILAPAVHDLQPLGISLTELVDGQGRTVAEAHARVRVVDDAQCLSGRGPCLDAVRSDDVQRSGDLTAEERWPEVAVAARAADVHSVLSVPVPDGREPPVT